MTEKLVATTRDGWTYAPASRWIKLRNELITAHSKFWDSNYSFPTYCCGYDDGRYKEINYFIHKGQRYFLEQFMRLSYPIFYEDKNGAEGVIGGYDATSYYNPYYIEIHPDGEYVRLWKEVH